MVLDETFSYQCFHPRDFLLALAQKGCLATVLGVPLAYAEQVLPGFWSKFRQQHPEHDLCSVPDLDYSHLVPYYLHGDGGRTYKKDSILICSMFPALGLGTVKNPVNLQPVPGQPQGNKKRAHSHGASQFEAGVNLRGNSFANRFLFTGMKVEFYKDKRHRFEKLMEIWAGSMRALFEEGFTYNGEIWRIMVIGMCGDAPFLREAGYHNRSFSNIRKSATATTQLKGVCWLCDAGRTGGPSFENPDIINAPWVHTAGPRNPLPWDLPGPMMEHIPIDQNSPADFYHPDIFHIWNLGVGKDFAASCVMYLLKTTFKKRSLGSSLDEFNIEMRAYMDTHSKDRCHFGRKLTLDLLGYTSSKDFPKGKWSKGGDTPKMCNMIQFVLEKALGSDDGKDDWIIQTMMEACNAMGQFMRILFKSPYFLKEEMGEKDASTAILAGSRFCRLYVDLARATLNRKLCLFKVKPKSHMLCHIVRKMFNEYQVDPHGVVNPVAFSTFQCEDFVGRVSRISRRVSARTHGPKIMNRYLVNLEMAFGEHGDMPNWWQVWRKR